MTRDATSRKGSSVTDPTETAAQSARASAEYIRKSEKFLIALTLLIAFFAGASGGYVDNDPSPLSYDLTRDWNEALFRAGVVCVLGGILRLLLRWRAQNLDLKAAAIEASLRQGKD
jgi:hypothetical protein